MLRLLFVILAALCIAQADESVSAGGRWVRVQQKDPKTGVETASFVLAGETADFERHPSIVLACTGRKEPLVLYNTDIRLGGQAHNVYNHYAPSIWALVKVDDGKVYRALWEIVPGPDSSNKAALLDKKTMRNLLTGASMRVRFSDYQDESHLDEFSMKGLRVMDMRETCGSKWFGKNDLRAASKPSRATGTEQ